MDQQANAAGGRRNTVIGVVLASCAVVGAIVLVLAIQRGALQTQIGGTSAAEALPPNAEGLDLEPPLARRLQERTGAVRENPQSAGAWGELALAYDVHELMVPAAYCYQQAIQLDPADFRWLYFRGMCLFIGSQREALDDFERAAAIRPEYAPVHVYMGRGYLKLDQLDDARRAFERAVELDDTLIRAHLGLGAVAIAAEDADTARGHLERAIALRPRTGEAHLMLAQATRRLGDADRAMQLQAVGARAPGLEPMPDPARAEATSREGVTLFWTDVRAEDSLARGQPAEARRQWLDAVRDQPQSARAHAGLGRIYAKTGELNLARDTLLHALELDPEEILAHQDLGKVYQQRSEFEQAIARYRRVLELDPNDHLIRNDLGALVYRSGEVDEGLALLRESCANLSGNAGAHLNLAIALRDASQLPEAATAIERALKIAPDFGLARLTHARILAQLDRLEESAAAFELIVEAMPGRPASNEAAMANAVVLFDYGMVLARIERYADAAAIFADVLAIDPQRISAYNNRAQALYRVGGFAEVQQTLREALDNNPEHLALQNKLAWFLATCPDDAQRRGAEAVTLAQDVCDRSQEPVPQWLDTLAAAHAEVGEFDKAVHLVQQAIDRIHEQVSTPIPEPVQQFLDVLQFRLEHYGNGEPYRDRGP